MDKQIVILNMKSRFLLSVVFFGMIAGLSASPVYRMGSYNIRGENAADTGDKDWNVRKEYVDENALSVTIKRLRDKLGAQKYIKTVYGIGYSWVTKDE